MTTLQKLRSWINWSLVKSSLKGSVVDESKFIRLLWTCSRFDLSPFWPYPSNCYSQNGVTVTVYCHDLLKSTFTVTSTIDMRYYTSFTNKQFWTIKHKLENENVNNSWTVCTISVPISFRGEGPVRNTSSPTIMFRFHPRWGRWNWLKPKFHLARYVSTQHAT